jgi:hypothetical protein
VQPVELTACVALDQQRDEIAQRPALESGVHTADHARHSRRRNRGVPMGEADDQLLDDRLFAQLDHPQSFIPVNRAVNLGSRCQVAADAISYLAA